MASKDNNLKIRQIIFGIALIILGLILFAYGFNSVIFSYAHISAYRFILGSLFIFSLAIALFIKKVNTKGFGIILIVYLLMDIILSQSSVGKGNGLVILNNLSLNSSLLSIALICLAIYFIFLKRNNHPSS
jgi:hypothetical protein